MKKLIGILLISFIACSAYSQDSSMSKMKKDYFIMKDGKVMVVKGSSEMTMNKTMTLSNGEMVMKDGTKLTGHLLNQDTFSIQLLDASERLRSVMKTDVRDYTYVKSSPMPSYRDTLTADERRDLVTYLVSLKGERP